MKGTTALGQRMLTVASALCGGKTLSILIYHQVVETKDPMRPDVPDREEFRWQMELLRTCFTPLPLASAVKQLKAQTLPDRAVCITFDDGYRDNLDVALPVLKQYRIPATVFVATHFSRGVNMWNDRVIDLFSRLSCDEIDLSELHLGCQRIETLQDKRRVCEQLLMALKYLQPEQRLACIDKLYQQYHIAEFAPKMMSPEQIVALDRAGVEIGAHTVDHPILKVLSPAQQYQQIADSKLYLEKLLGKPVTGFAYPNGKPGQDYDNVAVEHLKTLGFEYGVSTAWGANVRGASEYELQRFTPWEKKPLLFQRRLIWNQLAARFTRRANRLTQA